MERILEQVRENTQNTTLINESKYKCQICKDTTWIEGNGGLKRCSCLKDDLSARLWQNFGVDVKDIKLIKNYKPYNEQTEKARNKAINYIKNFYITRLEKENSFALLGQAGAGKTHLILAIGKALIDKKQKVVYMPYIEAMKELKGLVLYKEEYEKLIMRYKNADVLIIDDLFKDKVKSGQLIGELREADIKHIYSIINYRYSNKMVTLISSECNPEMLLNLDEAIAGRILEMCGPQGVVLILGDECDYRLKQFLG